MPAFPKVTPRDGLFLKDDFVSNETVTDALIGELRWERAHVSANTSSTVAYAAPTAANEHGILRLTTDGTADGDGQYFRTDEDAITPSPGLAWGCKIRLPDITGNTVANNDALIGLAGAWAHADPVDGVSLSIDAGVMTGRTDSADHGDASTALGVTMVKGTWYTVECFTSGTNAQGGPNEAQFWVNGVHKQTVACSLDDDETLDFGFLHVCGGTNDTLELDLDYMWLWIPRSA